MNLLFFKIYKRLFKKQFRRKEREKEVINSYFLDYRKRFFIEMNIPGKYLKGTYMEKIFTDLKKIRKRVRSIRIPFSQDYRKLIDELNRFTKHIRRYNERYLDRQMEKYRNYFTKCGLNSEQITAILTDENNTLVVAGPGSGKTRTLIERIAFYIIHKGVSPDKILVLAFNKSAVGEIKERLIKGYGIKDVEVRTFHSLGLKIVKSYYNAINARFKIEHNSSARITEIIREKMAKDPKFFVDFITFFKMKLSNINFEVYHELSEKKLGYKASKQYFCIDGTKVRSIAERDIGNFFIMNSIRFEYEKLADWCDGEIFVDEQGNLKRREYHPDFYLPDYDIYLEHWAIGEGEKTPEWFDGDPYEYNRVREWKRQQFKKYNKKLIETDYHMWREGVLEEKLVELCNKYGIERKPISREDLLKIIGKIPQDFGVLFDMIINFIQLLKSHAISANQFNEKILGTQKKLRAYDMGFYLLVLSVYKSYESYLHKNSKLDFSDMVNHAGEILEKIPIDSPIARSIGYTMIYVDEFQDISEQRFRLLQNLVKICKINRGDHNVSVFYVGDDWQAIYGFTGASNKYLVHYKQYYSPVKLIFLLNNYRNPPEIIEYGKMVIQRTSEYIPKKLRAIKMPDGVRAPIYIRRIYARDKEGFSNRQATEVISLIKYLINPKKNINYLRGEFRNLEGIEPIKPEEIMILSRFNFGYYEILSRLDEDPEVPVAIIKEGIIVKRGVRFYSIHKSKGLESKVVIILNAIHDIFGIPSMIEEGIDKSMILGGQIDELDEEARLYFVGLTRAEDLVFIFTWREHESIFIPKYNLRDIVQSSPDGSVILTGNILRTTEKAIQIELKSTKIFNEEINLWIPKSVVKNMHHDNVSGGYNILITSWWAKKKGLL